MTTTRTYRAGLPLRGWILLLLIGLAAFPSPGQAQIPNAVTSYQGTCWYYYFGSPWKFPVWLAIDSQIPDKQGQWASLSGALVTSSSFYGVSGTIWQSGWIDLYAFDYYWGPPLHFYGMVQIDEEARDAVVLFGNWEEYIYGVGYETLGTFYIYQNSF